MALHLTDKIHGIMGNHMLPFTWMHAGVGEAGVREMVRAARQSGQREVCVESRPHDHFCEDEWWSDMDALLDEAKKLDMRVWILDDKHFPTGYANGLVPKKYPERRKWQLINWYVDVVGPAKSCAVLAYPLSAEKEESLVRVMAYRHLPGGEEIAGPGYDLTEKCRDGYVIWDVPEGVWRIHFLVKTRGGTMQKDYIHLVDPESVSTLIEAVYEPHYAHYKQYFGNVIAGFFSDEPSFGNSMMDGWNGRFRDMYSNLVGQPGLALPWTEDILRRMDEELECDARPLLPLLWMPGEGQEKVRIAYMNAATTAWRDAFSYQLGNWCRERGVMYIGHIIEDQNAHAHLSCSGGHYFRSLEGQDMSGIDVVLHQIMPGMSDVIHTATGATNAMDPEFFDYVLAKLAASAAHLEPRKQGRAMCEVFGAFGWAEGMPFMTYLMNHMLVRGVNRFVPHAFSPAYPDPDCPPHFYAGGDNPQYPGFAKLMEYSNFVADILEGGVHAAQAAVLYHAEAEWSGRAAQYTQVPAKILYDDQIDFDIVPLDMLPDAQVAGGRLVINGVAFQALVIPGCRYLPEGCLKRIAHAGVPIYFVDYKPENMPGQVVARLALPRLFRKDVDVSPAFPLLRAYHTVKDGEDVFMFVNESMSEVFSGVVKLGCAGKYAYLDKMHEYFACGVTEDGAVPLTLAPYESVVLVFGEEDCDLPEREEIALGEEIKPVWTVAKADHESFAHLPADPDADPAVQQVAAAKFEPVGAYDALVNMTGFDAPGDVHFSGIIRYEADLDLTGVQGLDLGDVGQTAYLVVDSAPVGLRYCPGYRFDLRPLKLEGVHHVAVYVGNTLVHAHPDHFSRYMQIPASGLMGPVRKVEYRK